MCSVASVVSNSAIIWTVACQPPSSLEFSRQGYWSGLPCPPPGNLPDPGIEPASLALQADSLPTEPPGKPIMECINVNVLVLIMYCSYARGNHWRKQGQGYTGSFCTFLFVTSCKSIISSKKKSNVQKSLGHLNYSHSSAPPQSRSSRLGGTQKSASEQALWIPM